MWGKKATTSLTSTEIDEFVESLFDLSGGIRKEKGCLDFSLYWDMENENTYSVVGKWRTRQARLASPA